jgi:hypothetical protein
VAQFKRGDFSTCDASRPGRKTRYALRTLELVVHFVDLRCYNPSITRRENGSLRFETLWNYVQRL